MHQLADFSVLIYLISVVTENQLLRTHLPVEWTQRFHLAWGGRLRVADRVVLVAFSETACPHAGWPQALRKNRQTWRQRRGRAGRWQCAVSPPAPLPPPARTCSRPVHRLPPSALSRASQGDPVVLLRFFAAAFSHLAPCTRSVYFDWQWPALATMDARTHLTLCVVVKVILD